MSSSVGIGTGRARGRGNGLPPKTANVHRLPMHPPPAASMPRRAAVAPTVAATVAPTVVAPPLAVETPPAAAVAPTVAPPPLIDPPPLKPIDENQGVPDELYDACQRLPLFITPVAGKTTLKFYPHTSAWSPRNTFEDQAIVDATVWSKVPKNTKNYYYAEFAKKYKWKRSHHGEYRTIWETLAADRYRNWISHLKNEVWLAELDKPTSISTNCWNSFIKHWMDPKEQVKSARNKANRRGGVVDGEASSTHTGGSKPHFVHAMEMSKNGVPAKHIEVYKKLHTKDENSCNENAKLIIEAYDKKKIEDDALASQMLSGSICDIEGQPSPIDDDERFLQVIGPPKKGRWTAAQTESIYTPIGGIQRLSTPGLMIDDNRIAEIIQSKLDSTLNETIRNVVNDMIGVGSGDCHDTNLPQIETADGGYERISETNYGDGNEHAMDDSISGGEENIVGVNNDEFVINLLS